MFINTSKFLFPGLLEGKLTPELLIGFGNFYFFLGAQQVVLSYRFTAPRLFYLLFRGASGSKIGLVSFQPWPYWADTSPPHHTNVLGINYFDT